VPAQYPSSIGNFVPAGNDRSKSMSEPATHGQVAIVTGAGSGIGAAIARDLGARGTKLVLVGRRAELLDQRAAEIGAAGGSALAMPGDVRQFGDLERAVDLAIERWGRLDVLIANAAIADFGPIAEADPELWRDVIETNVLGVMFAVRAALPHMLKAGAGHIVITASGSGRVTYVGEPAYVASKHATVAFADCLRQEVAAAGIRVSLIEPGLVETPLIHVYAGSNDMVGEVDALSPDDIARAVRYVLDQPPGVNVFEVLVRPTRQLL
jgi:NADP-dependent 3-hydroxy acid dehydrogenase YdfG